jgi:TetR/AcrR family acrAB operon transcriptional repressor
VKRTKQEALATRNRILDTAERVFSRRGVSRTSLADIAGAAGVTRGAIYWHFEDKADLFSAMLARVTLPMEEMTDAARDEDDPLGAIRRCMVGVIERVTTVPQARRVFDIVIKKCEFVDEMAEVRERCVEMREKCLAQIERQLRRAVAKGQLPRGLDARRTAVGLHAYVDGLMANWIIDRRYFPLAREAGRMVDAYLAGLGARRR